jgi:ubiquitin-conjugating enzyme E2 Q
MALSAKKMGRIMKEIDTFRKLHADQSKLEFRFAYDFPHGDDNITIINIYITQLTPDRSSPVDKEMLAYKIPHIHFEFRFTDSYPFTAPFMRIVTPGFKQGTGHITSGNAFCLKELTPAGWSAAMDIECVMRSVLQIIEQGGAQINPRYLKRIYTYDEAMTSYSTVMHSHGWHKADPPPPS